MDAGPTSQLSPVDGQPHRQAGDPPIGQIAVCGQTRRHRWLVDPSELDSSRRLEQPMLES